MAFDSIGQKPGDCTMHETCDNYVVVEHNGDIYPCELFVITFLRVRGDRQHPSTASEKELANTYHKERLA